MLAHTVVMIGQMPPSMRLEFSTHLYATHLAQIPLFRGLGNSVIHTLCDIVEPMLAVRSQVIYSEGSVGKEMYILICGELEVTCNKVRLGFLSDGAFFGETPLLEVACSEAERRRRTVTAMTACKLCFITQDAMQNIMPKYPELALRLKRCARFSKRQINRKGKRFKLAQEEAGVLRPSLLTKSLSLGAFGHRIAGTTSAPNATGNDSPDNSRPPGLSSLLPALSASALSRRIDELQQVVARMDARAEDTAKSVEQTAKSVETILQHLELRAAGKEAV
jgi:CRP-like cAMP-binding protein